MAAAEGALSRRRQPDLQRFLMRRPECGAVVAVVAAWVMLLALSAGGAQRSGRHAVMVAMAEMDMASPAAPGALSVVLSGLPYWVLMTVAMMGPSALAGVRQTGLNSLRWRRERAMVEFSVAYLAVWTAFGIVALAAAALIPGFPGSAALVVVLAAAAAWQLSPLKRRWLRDCHRSVPLPPRGRRADVGALAFGLRNGLACLGSCWCVMLVMVAAPGSHLVWTAALAGVVTTEKLMERPRRATRFAAAALGVASAGAVVAALA